MCVCAYVRVFVFQEAETGTKNATLETLTMLYSKTQIQSHCDLIF